MACMKGKYLSGSFEVTVLLNMFAGSYPPMYECGSCVRKIIFSNNHNVKLGCLTQKKSYREQPNREIAGVGVRGRNQK